MSIKTETWSVDDLMDNILNNKIKKPKFQRRKKWENKPKPSKISIPIPNNKDYIEFLNTNYHSVHAITLALSEGKYLNIDGNNRINAISKYMYEPFAIFPELLYELFNILDKNETINNQNIKCFLKKLTYMDIIQMKTLKKCLNEKNKNEFYEEISEIIDDIDSEIENIQNKLKINKLHTFGSKVKIVVNIFENYSTEKLCKLFEDINSYDSQLTAPELLAANLYNTDDFDIDKSLKEEIENILKKYYNDNSNGEVLECYKHNKNDKINGFDYLMAVNINFKNNVNFKDKNNKNELPVTFKVWKSRYGFENENFNTNNVNDFASKMNKSSEIIVKTTPLELVLDANKYVLLICSIHTYLTNGVHDDTIIKSIRKSINYHFMLKDVSDKEKKKYFDTYDTLHYEPGGNYITDLSKKLLSNPENISNKLNKEIFIELIKYLNKETNVPYERKNEKGKNNNKNLRTLKKYEKIIINTFYKKKIPNNEYDDKYIIKQMIPNNSTWIGKLDKDRLGNLLPMNEKVDKGNNKRVTKILYTYSESDDVKKYLNYINDIIPEEKVYENIVECTNKMNVKIIDNDKYNNLCENNEQVYLDCFINYLF